MMPIHLVLVRHGKSEWNVAQHRSQKGDHSLYTEEFRNRHSSSARLTDLGKIQAKKAGEWLREEFASFDRHYVSPYARAIETAALLELPNAKWYMDLYLRERDGGDFEQLSDEERRTRFGKAMAMRSIEPFFWTPPNGESVATVCGRVDRMLDTLHRECSEKRVLLVLHGEMMWAFRVRLERMSSQRYKEINLSKDPKDRLHNCQVLQYTRRNPADSSQVLPAYAWMRSVNPCDPTTSRNEWEGISRSTYSNEDLLVLAEQYPRIVNDD